jgi:hypothetical protein
MRGAMVMIAVAGVLAGAAFALQGEAQYILSFAAGCVMFFTGAALIRRVLKRRRDGSDGDFS